MSNATTIIEGMVMEGKLDAGEAPVLIAGNFTGELNAVEVILDPTGVFNGQMNAARVELAGNFNGKLVTNLLLNIISLPVLGKISSPRAKNKILFARPPHPPFQCCGCVRQRPGKKGTLFQSKIHPAENITTLKRGGAGGHVYKRSVSRGNLFSPTPE